MYSLRLNKHLERTCAKSPLIDSFLTAGRDTFLNPFGYTFHQRVDDRLSSFGNVNHKKRTV